MAKILLVDDHEGVRSVIERVLTWQGHDVASVGDGTTAALLLGKRTYDLVITDYNHPGASAEELCRLAGNVLIYTAAQDVPGALSKEAPLSAFLETVRERLGA